MIVDSPQRTKTSSNGGDPEFDTQVFGTTELERVLELQKEGASTGRSGFEGVVGAFSLCEEGFESQKGAVGA